MEKLKFDNEGCYGTIAKDFTVANLSKLASAISQWLYKKYKKPSIVLGYDTRFANEIFVETLVKIFASKGVSVYLSENFTSSAMISFATTKLNVSCGIIITGRNENGYKNGLRIFDSNGFLLPEKDLKDIEVLNQETFETDADLINLNNLIEQGLINYINLNTLYLKHLNDNFDLSKISNNKNIIIIDPLYGSTQDILKRIFPGGNFLHDNLNPIFDNLIPECEIKNYYKLAEIIDNSENDLIGIGINAEGTKLCLYTKETGFIDFEDIILLLIDILIKNQKIEEKIVLSSFVSSRIYKLCNHYKYEIENIKNSNISYSLKIEDENRICLKNKFNFNDAIYIMLLIIDYLNQSNEKLNDWIQKIYLITDKKNTKTKKIMVEKNKINKLIEKINNKEIDKIGNLSVNSINIKDCYVFELENDCIVSLRISAINQIIEFFVETNDEETNNKILNDIMNITKTL